MKKRTLYFVDPTKVGNYHITLNESFISAITASRRIRERFDLICWLSKSTFANLSAHVRQRIHCETIPVISQDKHHVVRKSLLEFWVMAKLLLTMRKDDIAFVSCIMPTAMLLTELLNRLLHRRGLHVIIHGEEIEPYIEGRQEHWSQLGFWGEKWLKLRSRDSLITVVVIDDFIKQAFAENCSDKLDPQRIPIVHYPIISSDISVPPNADEPSLCFIGFRSQPKGFVQFEQLSTRHNNIQFLAIGEGRIDNLNDGSSQGLSDVEDFLTSIAGCSAAILPYTKSYTCVLSASALDALAVGTHIIATDLPFFRGLREYFGPEFVTIYHSEPELDKMLSQPGWLAQRRVGQMERKKRLERSKYCMAAVQTDFEELFLNPAANERVKLN